MVETERLRIAIFSDSALPIINGVSVSIDVLVSELRRRGHSVHIFTAQHPGFQDPDANTYRFRAIETPFAPGYPIAFPPYYRMLQKFRRQSFDVVHTHTPFLIGMAGLRWAESHGLPVVSTYHTLYDRYAHYFRILPRRYVRFRIAKHTNFYYNSVDHVISPSEASKKWLMRHSVSTPITVIPTASMPGPYYDRMETRRSLGMDADAKVLLYVGRLAKEKNLETLLAATAIAMHADASLGLWLVGDGPHRSECVACVRQLGIGDRVRFVGFVDRSAVSRYYTAADLFVFASITETQGLVIQEAMQAGLPAIAVFGGGAGTAIQDGVNGFVVKNEPQMFADALLKVLNDDNLHACLSSGARQTSRSWGIPQMCDAVTDIYQDVVNRRRLVQPNDKFNWL